MLRIEIVNRPSGEGVLRCTRGDGSTTWQKQDRHAAHFALHDLTHFAVDTVLRYRRGFFGLIADCLPLLCDDQGALPVEVVQSFFFMLDPFSAERKFTRFAALDPNGDKARAFVALEDWVNDGVPLATGVARDCARSWYSDNQPARGVWQIGGETVDPKQLRSPALVVVPSRDRIVPPSSAEALAAALGGATVLRPPLGHVGMMSAARAPETLWTEISVWLRARLGAE